MRVFRVCSVFSSNSIRCDDRNVYRIPSYVGVVVVKRVHDDVFVVVIII